jgi:hypothetical protein
MPWRLPLPGTFEHLKVDRGCDEFHWMSKSRKSGKEKKKKVVIDRQ